MVNEEIVIALRNAIDNEESLSEAVQIMINSGYNSEEVKEASHFVGDGALKIQEKKPEEELIMPEQKKSFISKMQFWKRKPSNINNISKPSESMKLSSESLNKQGLALSKSHEIKNSPTQQNSQQIMQQKIKQEISKPAQQPESPLVYQNQQIQQPPVQQPPIQQNQQPVQNNPAQVNQQIQQPQIQQTHKHNKHNKHNNPVCNIHKLDNKHNNLIKNQFNPPNIIHNQPPL